MQADSKTPWALSRIAKELYQGEAGWLIRTLQRFRPHICPFGTVAEHVPPDARLLDVGCGAGLFVLLLEKMGAINSAVGFDIATGPVAAANRAAARLGVRKRIRYEVLEPEGRFPTGDFNVVSAIDVLHHIPPSDQQAFVEQLCATVPPGGRLIIKDMVDQPRWRAWANTFHDLVMARQRVHHVSPQAAASWTESQGLIVAHCERVNTLWYGHWLLILDRPNE